MTFRVQVMLVAGMLLAFLLYACGGNSSAPHTPSAARPTEPVLSAAAIKGRTLFQANCTACHLMGKDALIGPGLAGIATRRDKAWVKAFVANSQAVIASGDKYAKALYEQYNQSVMTSFNFSDEEHEALWAYMKEAGE